MDEIKKLDIIFNSLEALANTSGKNDKKDLLRQQWLQGNETYNKVLTFLLDAMIVTQVSTKKIGKKINIEVDDYPETIEQLLLFLEAGKASTDLGIAKLQAYMDSVGKHADNIKQLATKKYRIGASAKSLNEAVGEKVINIFSCQLAKKYEDTIASHEKKAKKLGIKYEVAATLKLDGFRCICIIKTIDDEHVVNFYTRAGKEIDGLDHIREEILKTIDSTTEPDGFFNYVLDGELISNKGDWSSTAQSASSKDNDKSDLEYHVFDGLPLDEFWNGESTNEYYDRMVSLDFLFSYDVESSLDFVKRVPVLSIGTAEDCVSQWMPWVKESGYEGLMLNSVDGKYVTKRTSDLMKVKEFYTDDLLVLDVFEGEGAIANMLGGVIVDYKGHEVRVGSGFNHDDRHKYWKNKADIIGKVIEVQYFEETTNIKDDGLSLRFPTYKGIRIDKTAKDVNYEAV